MDDIDVTTERQAALDDMAIAAASEQARRMVPGAPGICDKCGEHSLRLMDEKYFESKGQHRVAANIIKGICPPCRDKHRLP